MKLNRIFSFAIITASLLVSAAAFAGDTYVYETINPNSNPDGGKINSIKTSYKADNTDFAWYANFGPAAGGQKTEGFWLVVSPGPNPKGNAGELAMMYFDATKSKPELTVYAYNGHNADNSFKEGEPGKPADKILSSKLSSSWIKDLSVKIEPNGTRTLGFRINAAEIQSHSPVYPGSTPWTGVEYGKNIGIWFHPVAGVDTKYGQDGFLSKFTYRNQGWFDSENCPTQCVPEPGSFAAIGLGLAGLISRKARKA